MTIDQVNALIRNIPQSDSVQFCDTVTRILKDQFPLPGLLTEQDIVEVLHAAVLVWENRQ